MSDRRKLDRTLGEKVFGSNALFKRFGKALNSRRNAERNLFSKCRLNAEIFCTTARIFTLNCRIFCKTAKAFQGRVRAVRQEKRLKQAAVRNGFLRIDKSFLICLRSIDKSIIGCAIRSLLVVARDATSMNRVKAETREFGESVAVTANDIRRGRATDFFAVFRPLENKKLRD